MSNINLNLYRIFCAVASSKSYSEASEKINLSVPNISTQILNLENQLDVKLFNREKDGVKLTDAGKELYDIVSKGMLAFEYGEKVLKEKNDLSNGIITIGCMSVRSSDEYKEEKQLDRIKGLCNKYNLMFNLDVKKPFFPYKEKSYIRELLANTYKELYNRETTVKKIHACREGGIISSNIDNLDICTIAPTIDNCHSVNERVSISSTIRVYNWLKETLIKYNKDY